MLFPRDNKSGKQRTKTVWPYWTSEGRKLTENCVSRFVTQKKRECTYVYAENKILSTLWKIASCQMETRRVH